MSKWFKGYFISSTYAQDISKQSCITNRETPCTSLQCAKLLLSSLRLNKPGCNTPSSTTVVHVELISCEWDLLQSEWDLLCTKLKQPHDISSPSPRTIVGTVLAFSGILGFRALRVFCPGFGSGFRP